MHEHTHIHTNTRAHTNTCMNAQCTHMYMSWRVNVFQSMPNLSMLSKQDQRLKTAPCWWDHTKVRQPSRPWSFPPLRWTQAHLKSDKGWVFQCCSSHKNGKMAAERKYSSREDKEGGDTRTEEGEGETRRRWEETMTRTRMTKNKGGQKRLKNKDKKQPNDSKTLALFTLSRYVNVYLCIFLVVLRSEPGCQWGFNWLPWVSRGIFSILSRPFTLKQNKTTSSTSTLH